MLLNSNTQSSIYLLFVVSLLLLLLLLLCVLRPVHLLRVSQAPSPPLRRGPSGLGRSAAARQSILYFTILEHTIL